jgi:hypothetical protein
VSPLVVSADGLTAAEAAEDALRGDPAIPIAPGRWGLEPYPPPHFLRLLAVALAVPGLPARPVFCDIGAWGVEAVRQYQQQAVALGADVILGEAEDQDYAAVDVAYVNCPYRDPGLEAAFEGRIRQRLPGGCVLISVNHHHPPAGWTVVLDEPAGDRGVYVKPPPP